MNLSRRFLIPLAAFTALIAASPPASASPGGRALAVSGRAARPNAKTRHARTRGIINTGNGKCLTTSNHGTTNTTPLVISTCIGGTNQKWTRG